jgi:hypothetical protein
MESMKHNRTAERNLVPLLFCVRLVTNRYNG